MGDFFELQEAGILDEMGEYIGNNDSIDHYHHNEAYNRNNKVRNFMKERGLFTPKAQKRALKEYGLEVRSGRPTFHACNNWNTFKFFINKRVGYIKPSKKIKDASNRETNISKTDQAAI